MQREREEKEEPVLKFSDARISRGSFVREKERPHVTVARADPGNEILVFNSIPIVVVSRLVSSLELRAASIDITVGFRV